MTFTTACWRRPSMLSTTTCRSASSCCTGRRRRRGPRRGRRPPAGRARRRPGRGRAASRQPSPLERVRRRPWPAVDQRLGPGREDPRQCRRRLLDGGRVQPRGVDGRVAELVARDQHPQEADVGGQPEDRGVVEGVDQGAAGGLPVGPVHDDLAEHRVVGRRHDLAALQRGVDPHPAAAGENRSADPGQRTSSAVPACGRKPWNGVLGVDPGLDRVAVQRDVVLGERQRLAGRDPELELHEVERLAVDPTASSVTGCSTWRRVFISRK